MPEIETCPKIRLHQGAAAIVEIDLSDFDFQGGEVVFTMRKTFGSNDVIKTCAFSAQEVAAIFFEDDFTACLKCGGENYEYDIMLHIDGERFALCDPSPVEVCRTVGGCTND